MKTVLLVPGGKEDLASRDYKSLISAIESKGYKVEFVPIRWTYTTISDWVEELNNSYAQFKSEDVILAGFSWGSMTAFISASNRNPSELWLFSLSPYFSEDSMILKKYWLKDVGMRRIKEFKKYSFNKLAKNIKCKTLLFVGENELTGLRSRVDIANKLISSSKLFVVPNCGHELDDSNYVHTIVNQI